VKEIVMTRWPNSDPPGVQPYNDRVRADLEAVLEQVVALADRAGTTGVEMIEIYRAVAFGDSHPEPAPAWFDELEDVLEPYTMPEFDLEDLTFELLDLVGTPDCDDFNE
jgi:hypothetical protein